MKKLTIVFSFLFFGGFVFAQDTEAPEVEVEEVVLEIENVVPKAIDDAKNVRMGKEYEEDCPYAKHFEKKGWKWKGDLYKKGYYGKDLKGILVHKLVFGVVALVFLFLAAFVVRKGWDRGGTKKK